MPSDKLETLAFADAARWEAWLAKHHARSPGIWLRIYKKPSGIASVTYAEALDAALAYGWIDGQKQRHDEASWLQRFTRRGARSAWSKLNTQRIERLIKAGKMHPAGLTVVKAAQGDGRWKVAYASPANAKPPQDFLARLNQNQQAKAFYKTLNKSNTYSIIYRLHSAKRPETRERRMHAILEMLQRGEKFHP